MKQKYVIEYVYNETAEVCVRHVLAASHQEAQELARRYLPDASFVNCLGTVSEYIRDTHKMLADPEASIEHLIRERKRFVMTVGCYREEFDDIPYDLPVGIYDRLLGRMVVTLDVHYNNLICLEHTGEGGAPFTALEDWLNNTSGDALRSEGIPT